MILGVSTSGLSQLYKQQTTDYTKTLEQIAAGKRFIKPSDDFASYMKQRAAESSIARYQSVNDELVRAKESSTVATSVGNSLYEGLLDLKKLVAQYGATSDTDEKAKLKEVFDAKATDLQALFDNNQKNNGTAIDGTTVKLVEGDTMTLDLSTAAAGITAKIGGTGGLDITAGTIDVDIDNVLTSAATYTATAESFSSAVDRQLTINQNTIAAKEDTASAIGAIDEVAAISKATALAVRQQATISMAAQANISQSNLARLFS